MRQVALPLGLALLAAGCFPSEKPVQLVNKTEAPMVYDLELAELKRLLTTAGIGDATWHRRAYLNPRILLPVEDSATVEWHDAAWLRSVQVRGLVDAVCGPSPAQPCDSVPHAFISLGVPWTRDGDTIFVGGGYVAEVPGQEISDGIFWLFKVAETDSGLRVVGKGPPNRISF